MGNFQIYTNSGDRLEFKNELSPAFQKFKMAADEAFMSEGDFGKMAFQHFKGNGFDIWYSNYLITKDYRFIGEVYTPLLELQIPLLNSFNSTWDGIDHIPMEVNQYEITCSPAAKVVSTFQAGISCHTFDVHFQPSTLFEYAVDSRKLSRLLEANEKGNAANLLDDVQFASPDMLRIIHSIIRYEGQGNLAKPYFDALIREFLVYLVSQVNAFSESLFFSLSEIKKAEEAKKIILSDFEEFYSVKELARMSGLTEIKLQMAFKHLYGTTVSKFSRQSRMEEGYRLLSQTNYPLRVICLMVGYPDPSNFSAAFFSHFGFRPGVIQKGRR